MLWTIVEILLVIILLPVAIFIAGAVYCWVMDILDDKTSLTYTLLYIAFYSLVAFICLVAFVAILALRY
jgi:hypothetical protein